LRFRFKEMYIFRAAIYLLIATVFFASHALAQRQLTIAEIQGGKNVSPHVGQMVLARGVVTARTKTGFFMQTPDENADKDPNTSEGIFVFTRNEPPSPAEVGRMVEVGGRVEEFKPRNENATLTITEISHRIGQDPIRPLSAGNPLPKPTVITTADFMPNSVDQLEKYEGMRVTVEQLVVTGPTDGKVDIRNASSETYGTFYGVVKGMARPFREPGLDALEFLALDEKEKEKLRATAPKLTIFDGNPERIRVESTAQGGPSIEVTSSAEVSGLMGVLHYAFRSYAILVDPTARPEVKGGISARPLPPPGERQFSIASINLENFFDDRDDPGIKEDVLTAEAFSRRLKKVSAAVREFMQMPDVIGIVEVEDLATLRRLAERINADAAAGGRPDPKYAAYLVDGNDGRGIDNGFLVKSSRVQVIETKQLGKDEKYRNPDTGEQNFLNDRPSLLLRASIDDPKTGKPFAVTLIVSHLKSFLGYSDPKQMANVRMKKSLQAYYLGGQVRDRLKADPAEKIILLGDLNAYQFNDGVMDMVGTIKGKPPERGAVTMPSDDLIDPDLTDLVDLINPREKYSYVFDGTAQVLDHILITESLRAHVKGFGYVRLNADFPEIYRNSDARVERFSDHDPAVAYFSLDQ
jgi:predicted extracellular nuclease